MNLTKYRFYVPTPLRVGEHVALPERVVTQLVRVLRARPGSTITLFDGSGSDFVAELQSLDDHQARALVREARPARPLPPPPLTLVQAILRHDHFDLVVEKATELGVLRIIPLRAHRCVVQLDARGVANRLARWERIAIEASEQCGRATPPVIEVPCTFRELFARLQGQRVLVFAEQADPRATIRPPIAPDEPLTIAVGPEGGWTAEELEQFRDAGAQLCSLGPLILRAETAAIAGIATVRALAHFRSD